MPQNGINYSGVVALALAMQHNPELRVLNLNDNTFSKRGTLAMAQVRLVCFQVSSAFETNLFSKHGFCLSIM